MNKTGKALCLALSAVIVLGMTAAAGKAAYFTDEDEIKNSKAVTVLTDLNIMQGKEDGSFDPSGSLSRAELCRIICLALNGGKDPELGTVAWSFPDIGGHWAAGYIEYCFNLGIVAGRGDGNFDPDGAVTGSQAVKMLLVSIGYDSEIENFVGKDWAIAANVRANQKDFFEGLDGDDFKGPSAALTRDQAAQMIYNALSAVMVEYEYRISSVNGELQSTAVLKDAPDGQTILSQKFKVIS